MSYRGDFFDKIAGKVWGITGFQESQEFIGALWRYSSQPLDHMQRGFLKKSGVGGIEPYIGLYTY